MNRHERRAATAKGRKLPAAPTATGYKIFLPDGETVYVSAADARAMAGAGPARGHA